MDNWQLLTNSEFCDGELSSVSKIEQVMVLYQACSEIYINYYISHITKWNTLQYFLLLKMLAVKWQKYKQIDWEYFQAKR